MNKQNNNINYAKVINYINKIVYTHQQGYLIKIGIWIPDTIELLRIFIIDINISDIEIQKIIKSITKIYMNSVNDLMKVFVESLQNKVLIRII